VTGRRPGRPASLALLLVLAACDAGTTGVGTDPEPSFSGHPAVTAANNRDWLPAALGIIQGATFRLHVVEYEIYDDGPVDELLDALADAAGRGVELLVLADDHEPESVHALERITTAGGQAHVDSTERTTHNKLVIADDQTLVGSTNWSSSSIDENNETDALVSMPEVTGWYERYFEALWADPESEPDLPRLELEGVVPLANRSLLPALLDCIASADDEVGVVMYAIAYDPDWSDSEVASILDGLDAAVTRGVKVRVILDGSAWIVKKGINDDAAARLVRGGAELRFTPPSVITHAKLLTCDTTVIVSDCNWSYSSLQTYNGTSVQVTDTIFAGSYRDYFQILWNGSQEAAAR
jgi:phosphatidylserine/phosphatidylglycerophosphate/cardiolipin synthase-like enzyme